MATDPPPPDRHRADPARLAERRAAYAHAVATRYGPGDASVEAAFAAVPREAFVGPPPWHIGGGGTRSWASTWDEMALYEDELVALDGAKGINNGQPSLHALCITALGVTAREHVLHVGAGTGYYTAILSRLAGSVEAYEIDPRLATMAAANLAAWPNVTLHAESAAGRALPTADAIYVSAGATHPDPFWLDALRAGGRLLFPLTGHEDWGGLLLATRLGSEFAARFVSDCGFIPCVGARDSVTATRLTAAFRAGGHAQVRSLRRTRPSGPSPWFAGDGWHLSTEPPA